MTAEECSKPSVPQVFLSHTGNASDIVGIAEMPLGMPTGVPLLVVEKAHYEQLQQVFKECRRMFQHDDDGSVAVHYGDGPAEPKRTRSDAVAAGIRDSVRRLV